MGVAFSRLKAPVRFTPERSHKGNEFARKIRILPQNTVCLELESLLRRSFERRSRVRALPLFGTMSCRVRKVEEPSEKEKETGGGSGQTLVKTADLEVR